MTRSALAQDRVRCWSLIARCERVGMPIPAKWLRHGRPPASKLTQVHEVTLAVFTPEAIDRLFRANPLVEYLRRHR